MARATVAPPAPPPMPHDAMRSPYVRVGDFDVKRFLVSDVDALLRAGVVPEDGTFELLNGLIVRKDRATNGGDVMAIGLGHSTTVEHLSDLRIRLNAPQRHVRSQQPLQCGPYLLPEPDFALVRGTISDYAARYPTGSDALCVVEVADSSYERDVGEKLIAYARAGVPQYVVINLRDRTAEVFETPDVEAGSYATRVVTAADGTLSLRAGEGGPLAIPLVELLP